MPARTAQFPNLWLSARVRGERQRGPNMSTEKPKEAAEKKPFLATLPGILTAIAAVITALAGLVAALGPTGLLRGRDAGPPVAASAPRDAPTPTAEIATTGDGSPVISGAGGDVSVTVGQ